MENIGAWTGISTVGDLMRAAKEEKYKIVKLFIRSCIVLYQVTNYLFTDLSKIVSQTLNPQVTFVNYIPEMILI